MTSFTSELLTARIAPTLALAAEISSIASA